jgi:GDP-D-mannose dehydratase
VVSDACLSRPSDIKQSRGNPVKAWRRLGWKYYIGFKTIVRMLRAAQSQNFPDKERIQT